MSAQAGSLTSFLPITSLQALRYQVITHTFAQRRPAISSVLSTFRTLSIATEVVPFHIVFGRSVIRNGYGVSFVFTTL